MPLQTSPGFICLFLEPPGNEARELALFRRALFASRGDAAGLALPEAVPLAYAEARGARSGPVSRRPALARLWKDYEALAGRRSVFRLGEAGVVEREGFLYLELEPPFAALAKAAEAALADLGYVAESSGRGGLPGWLPRPGLGFSLGRASPGALSAIEALGSRPELSFRAADLVLCRMYHGGDALPALAWKELARVKRPAGPPARSGSAPAP